MYASFVLWFCSPPCSSGSSLPMALGDQIKEGICKLLGLSWAPLTASGAYKWGGSSVVKCSQAAGTAETSLSSLGGGRLLKLHEYNVDFANSAHRKQICFEWDASICLVIFVNCFVLSSFLVFVFSMNIKKWDILSERTCPSFLRPFVVQSFSSSAGSLQLLYSSALCLLLN